ncbi:hypothetical protein DAEQUDRAFT_185717 [Daedalea quercina L-15889]|uniref:Uncharacterized protein n=1 Tax=Daedalea quercina L-15889 TaxID=1314783 RepID=A0A165KHZ8_9APHY|nr:hypothetical protein DAEQUDRAFT_185717 [Daedalea quercina L-15889]
MMLCRPSVCSLGASDINATLAYDTRLSLKRFLSWVYFSQMQSVKRVFVFITTESSRHRTHSWLYTIFHTREVGLVAMRSPNALDYWFTGPPLLSDTSATWSSLSISVTHQIVKYMRVDPSYSQALPTCLRKAYEREGSYVWVATFFHCTHCI